MTSLDPRPDSRTADGTASGTAPHGAPDDPVVLPAAPERARRTAFPLLAAIVPVAGGAVMWAVTGTATMMWFALLGPAIAGAAFFDARRSSARERRVTQRHRAQAIAAARVEIGRRHAFELAQWREQNPDLRGMLAADSVWLGGDEIVIGRGHRPSAVTVTGTGEDSVDLVRAARTVDDAPIAVPWGRGVSVIGDPVLGRAIVRALVVQLCVAQPPARVAILAVDDELGISGVPHAANDAAEAATRVVVGGPGVSAAPSDVVFASAGRDAPPDPRCGIVLDVDALDRAWVVRSGERTAVRVEAIGRAQAEAVAAGLRLRHEAARGRDDARSLGVGDLDAADGVGAPGRLRVALGADAAEPLLVDLVADGPHAVVAGVTGSGKSELLTTWILALCAAYPPRQLVLLLADFKGGTAFRRLEHLSHVAGVVTDLDATLAERAISSLRAELRHRETVLADAGARAIDDPGVDLPRLVIVVDEFAALTEEHRDLVAVFTDIAARGRALGMHLVLGTQRVTGVVREGLLANCPLRIALRLTDAGDARQLMGVDDATRLPGGEVGRGIALVRRSADGAARRTRIPLSDEARIAHVRARHEGAPPPREVWLPPLPRHLAPEDLSRAVEGLPADPGARSLRLALALADEPHRQRRGVRGLTDGDTGLFVVGGPGSGRTSVVRAAAAAAAPAGLSLFAVAGSPERAWDALVELDEVERAIVLVDDVDLLVSRWTGEYQVEAIARLEGVLREARHRRSAVVMTAQRAIGGVARLAELFTQRAVLALPTRSDHIAAGGDPAHYAPGQPPGRATWGPDAVQFVLAPSVSVSVPVATVDEADAAVASPWDPQRAIAGIVTDRPAKVVERLASGLSPVAALASLPPGAGRADFVRRGQSGFVVGDGAQWQAQWRLLTELRDDGALAVDAACPAELRMLLGVTSLPPFARKGHGFAWVTSPDGRTEVDRTMIPALATSSPRRESNACAPGADRDIVSM